MMCTAQLAGACSYTWASTTERLLSKHCPSGISVTGLELHSELCQNSQDEQWLEGGIL